MTNRLHYGDNLAILKESIASESNLDPPFNSNASYNVLFKAPSGEGSQAQIEAFEDTSCTSSLSYTVRAGFDRPASFFYARPRSYSHLFLRLGVLR
jgi:hypothetical protein